MLGLTRRRRLPIKRSASAPVPRHTVNRREHGNNVVRTLTAVVSTGSTFVAWILATIAAAPPAAHATSAAVAPRSDGHAAETNTGAQSVAVDTSSPALTGLTPPDSAPGSPVATITAGVAAASTDPGPAAPAASAPGQPTQSTATTLAPPTASHSATPAPTGAPKPNPAPTPPPAAPPPTAAPPVPTPKPAPPPPPAPTPKPTPVATSCPTPKCGA